MNDRRRRVIFLALGIAAVLLGTELMGFFSHDSHFEWREAFSHAYLVIAIKSVVTFSGGALYAILARRRGNLTLGDCSLGGALVGFCGVLIGEALSSIFLVVVGVSWSVDLTLGSLIGCSVLFNIFIYPLFGILLGGAGGGAIGILASWRSGPRLEQ